MTYTELTQFLDELIEQNKGFAVYRIPGNEHIKLLIEEETLIPDTIESLNKKSGFVIAPFQITTATPLVLINGKEEEILLEDSIPDKAIPAYTCRPVDKGYKERFDLFLRSLKNNELDKLVLSRKEECKKPDQFSPGETFLRACKWYIRSYVYLFHTPQTGTWLGSTPEIILSGEGENWHTVALAGTQPISNGQLPESWDNKNIEEQALVARYIKNQLATLGIEPTEKGPYSVRAAELAHLKSDFTFKLPDNAYLGNLLKLLHPTPAVCGLPKEKAYRFIIENEGYNRQYYSGFIGKLDWENGTNLYVNLRCMQILNDKLCLYAGGGLLASSTPEEEWQETEDKLLTMKRIINKL